MIRMCAIYSIIVVALSQSALAKPLDFQQQSVFESTGRLHELVDIRCHRPGETNAGGCDFIPEEEIEPDTTIGSGSYGTRDSVYGITPFLMEYFRADDGRTYYHVSIGHPQYGFAQSTYIPVVRFSGGLNGANPGEYDGLPISASLGDTSCLPTLGSGWALSLCNAGDPLGAVRGNDFGGSASANPARVRMRQIIGGTWDEVSDQWSCALGDAYCQEFLKDEKEKKPIMTQTVRDINQDLEANWGFDMSNSDYETDTIAGIMSNTVKLGAVGGANFDYSDDRYFDNKVSELTGGRYKFVGNITGAGELPSTEPYEYWKGDFKIDRDWSSFADPDQTRYGSDNCYSTVCTDRVFD